MKKFLVFALALTLVFAATAAQAAYVSGTTAGSNIAVGGDGGSANSADVAGDVVASYTSNLGTDTTFKVPTANGQVNVSQIFGDTVAVIGAASATFVGGESNTFNLRVTNYANSTDSIHIFTDTPSVTGANSGSVTVKINGSTVYLNGSDSYSHVILNLAAGADTLVTVQILHDSGGPLGAANVTIKTKAKGGLGGDAGGYLGLNSDNYAGVGDDTSALTINVKQIKLFTDVIIDSTNVPGAYNGNAGDSVPGMKIQYTFRYDNDGNDTAENFILNMRIPANTALSDTPTATAHTGATGTVFVYNASDTPVLATDATAVKVVVRFNIGVGADDADDGANALGGPFPDVDAGSVSMRVYIK